MPSLEIENIGSTPAAAVMDGVHVLHSCHLNAALLRVLYEADGIDAAAILREAGAAAADDLPLGPRASDREQRAARIVDAVARAGLGRADLSRLTDECEGEVRLYGSHFARAWSDRFRNAGKPVCAATGEILAVLISRSEGRRVELRETACAARGASSCIFRVERGPAFDAAGIRAALDHGDRPSLDLDVDGLQGAGGPFTRLPATFHASVAAAFEREVPLQRGAKFGNLPGILLLEAAHRGAYHLFGEMLRDEELAGMPTEGRLQILLQRLGEMGWGGWQATTFLPGERLIVQIRDSAEAVAFERLGRRADGPRCHIARGAAAAMMNLLFRRDSVTAPLNDADYNRVFRSPASFRAVETRCRAQGEDFCEIIANPLTL